MMIPDLILFFGLALVAVGSALGMLFSRNAVYSALNLIINFVTVSIFYLLLSAPFIALSQVTVYAGAIMVLFLFVIMLLGAERLAEGKTLVWQRPLALGLGLVLIIEVLYLLIIRPSALPVIDRASQFVGDAASIGQNLFSVYLLPFEIISILLLVAMVGVIVLTKRKNL
jgi:NADH-quinone oxidoreductase subunit J